MLENPAVKVIKEIPATWDETIVLPSSKIGEVAAFARRSGKTWFLAVLNGQKECTIQFPLTFLDDGWYEGTVLNDNPSDAAASYATCLLPEFRFSDRIYAYRWRVYRYVYT